MQINFNENVNFKGNIFFRSSGKHALSDVMKRTIRENPFIKKLYSGDWDLFVSSHFVEADAKPWEMFETELYQITFTLEKRLKGFLGIFAPFTRKKAVLTQHHRSESAIYRILDNKDALEERLEKLIH